MFRRNCAYFFLLLTLSSALFAQDTKENADFKLAVNLYGDKMYDLAAEQFKQFISNYPASPQSIDARFYLGLIQRSTGKLDEARATFQSFALTYADNPRAPEAWWNIGEMWAIQKRYAEAASAFERIKVFHPKSNLAPRALLTSSDYFERAADSEDAKRTLRSLLSDYPTDKLIPEAHARLGAIFLREHNATAAKRELSSAAEGGSTGAMKARVNIELGSLAESEGDFSEAERLYRSVADEKPASDTDHVTAAARLSLATLYFHSGQRTEAIAILKQMLADSATTPNNLVTGALDIISQASYEAGDFPLSVQTAARFATISDDTAAIADARLRMGRAYESMKNGKGALASYAANASIPSSYAEKRESLLRAGRLAQSLKDARGASRFFGAFIEEYPDDENAPEALFRLAELERRSLDEPQKAIELYRRLPVRYPKSERVDDAAYGLARALESAGDPAGAILAYDDLVAKYPASPFVPDSRKRSKDLTTFHSPKEGNSVEQLARLIGDLILEKPKAELAMRLGDIYLNVLQDFKQAQTQYEKAASLSGDSTVIEEARYRYTQALVRRTASESDMMPQASKSLSQYVAEFPTGRFTEDAAYDLLMLRTRNARPDTLVRLAGQFVKSHPRSPHLSEALLLLGDAQASRGLLNESIVTYRKLVSAFPTSSQCEEAQAMLGIQLSRLGMSDSAASVLSGYLRIYPHGSESAEVLFELGTLQVRSGEVQDGIRTLEDLRTRFFYTDRAEECRETLAGAYRTSSQFPRAVTLYRKLIAEGESPLADASSGTPRFVLSLAHTYDDAHDTVQARSAYRSYLERDDRSKEAAAVEYRLALLDEADGRIPSALKNLQRSVETSPAPLATSALASLLYRSASYEEAIDQYSALLTLPDIDSAAARTAKRRIAVSLFRLDRSKEAEVRAADYLHSYPDDREAEGAFTLEKALIAFRAENHAAALKELLAFPEKLRTTNAYAQVVFWIGKIYEAQNLTDKALEQYTNVVASFPSSDILPKTYLALGNIYYLREDYQEAVRYYRLIVDRSDAPLDVLPYAMSNLVEAYKGAGLYDAALELTRTFIARFPTDESILNKRIDLGVLYEKLGYYDQAIVQLSSLLETTNKDLEAELRYDLGETYYYKGDYQQAILEFLKVPYLITKKTKIDWTPNSFYMSAQSYEKMGKIDQALAMYQQIIDRPGIDPAFKTAAQKEINRVKSMLK